MKCRQIIVACTLGVSAAASACAPAPPTAVGAIRYKLNGPLIPARMTMVTAWDFPRNPLTDTSLDDDSPLSKQVQWGYRIFTNTPGDAGQFAPGRGSCNNCHLNAGQREKALPLVGVAGLFPEYNRRAGRLISLGDRIVDGADGQGVAVGDKKPGPLWGPDSWHDGAGAARIYTLAGIIRFTMPYLDPGSLSDEDAQHLSAFINSKPRPSYPFKDQDYLVEKLSVDSVY